MPDTELLPQQNLFVEKYLITLNARIAAEEAEYAHPHVQGPRLLKNPKVRAVIDERLKEAYELVGVTPQFVINKLLETLAIAEASVKPKFNSNGKQEKDKDGNLIFVRDQVTVLKTLELIGKHLNMWAKEAPKAEEESADTSTPAERLEAFKRRFQVVGNGE